MLHDIRATFLCISQKPLLRSWIWLYHQKANETYIPTIYCPYGNILHFSRTSRIHFSSFRPFKPMGLSAHRHIDTQKWKHNIRQFHSVYLADIINKILVIFHAFARKSPRWRICTKFSFGVAVMDVITCEIFWRLVKGGEICGGSRISGFHRQSLSPLYRAATD